MNSGRLPRAILRVASLLAPERGRAEWLQEWRSELWYVPQRRAVRFTFGAFWDALWLRRNSSRTSQNSWLYLDSPMGTITLLALFAAICLVISVRIEPLLPFPPGHGGPALKGFLTLVLLYVLLGAVALNIGDFAGNSRWIPRPNTFRSWMFLAIKFILIVPILNCFFMGIIVAKLPALTFVFYGFCVFAFRWAFADQRRRCPVCLRLLTEPVRIGTASQTFLEWYGAESVCSRGCGFLHVPETSASYSGTHKWLNLDQSWRSLFTDRVELG